MKNHCKDCLVEENGLFSNLIKQHKDKIACIMARNKYRKGQVIFLEGNSSHYIYAVRSGIVKTFKMEVDGKTHILKVLKDGDLLAFDAIYSNDYHYSAEAIEDSEICMMRKDDFIALLKREADMAIELIKVLTRELEEARCYITYLATKTASQKIAQFLLSSPSVTSSSSSVKKLIILPLSRKELSELLALSPETVSRTFSQFEKDKILKVNGKEISICDTEKLSLLSMN